MRKWYPIAVVAAAVLASALLYGSLPDRMPMHWDAHGEVDRWGSRLEGAFLLPAIMAAVAFLVPVLPRIDPRGASYEKFRPSYHLVMNATLTLLLGVHLAVLATSLGVPVPIDRVIPAGVGVLLVVMGNVLPRARPNWMFGIRTPWTLSSERVWERTHRFGGYLMFGAGVVVLAAALLARGPDSSWIIVASVLAASLGSMAYSYVAWRRENHS